MCTMSMRALLLYVKSTHAWDTTTDSMSECVKVKPNFWIFLKTLQKEKNWQKPFICSTDSDTAVLPKEENGET